MYPKRKSTTPSRRAAFWLSQAEHHIHNRRLYLARRILESIHDPDAHALLDDLNTIAPPLSAPTCPLCGYGEFTWHRTVSVSGQKMDYLKVDNHEVFSRLCAACSNVQFFLQLPVWAQLES